ncbi:glycoside hydrolase family 19 protein [Paraburkholderia ginsengisoli]|uniref:Lytic transglycosylase, catalytic n=1 Tax=Paraburkholderia ginsengisoli TaxID=311231 RepID=A0A7T4N210_9BURK|nr:glycoside hydrolase family 19 protein [Paraburkholderia ginsengisoli]QQC63806.1 lytic transglycosylase, catalytic [Paraburkholderia ginsengisoli]
MKSDDKGFLIADKPLNVADLSEGIGGIRSDTSAILAMLKSSVKDSVARRQKVAQSAAPQSIQRASRASTTTSRSIASVPAPDRQRDARGRFIAGTTGVSALTQAATAVKTLTRQQGAQYAEARRAEASRDRAGVANAGQSRDARGRFGSGGGHGDGGVDGQGILAHLKGLGSSLHSPGVDVAAYEKLDPTVEAGKELSKIVSGPLGAVGKLGKATIGRGFGLATGKNSPIPWYRKIFSELRLTREQASEFNIAQERTLKDIDKKTGGEHGSGKGMLGSLAGMLGGLLGKGGGLLGKGGGLMKALLGGGLRMMKGGGGLLGSLGKGALGLGKIGLRRLPLLGALFAGGSALASIFGGDDPNKTAEENHTDRFKGAGSGIGALIGGGLGTLVGGPVGTMIGGVIGDRVGELVGEWLSKVDWSAVGKQITGAWDATTGFFKDSWKTVTDKLGDITKAVSAAWSSIVDGAKEFLKDKFGIDIDAIKEKAAKTVAPVVDAAKQGVQVAKDAGKAAVDYGKDRVEKMAEPIKTAAANAVDVAKGVFGGGSKGNKAALVAEMNSSGMTNGTERAMFMAQMDHESGGFRSLEESTKYKPRQFLKLFGKRAGITTEEQAQAIIDKGPDATAEAMYGGDWGKKNLGNTEAGDGAKFKGRGFVQITGRNNYAAAAKATGLDLIAHPELAADPANAAKIAVWFQRSRKGLVEASQNGDVLAATKKINGGTIGLDDRSRLFKQYLAEMNNPGFSAAIIAAGKVAPGAAVAASVAPSVAPPTVQVAAATPVPIAPVPTVTPPPMNVPPPPAVAAIPTQLNTPGPLDVRITNSQQAGQDLSDRQLAHIATGGLSAG